MAASCCQAARCRPPDACHSERPVETKSLPQAKSLISLAFVGFSTRCAPPARGHQGRVVSGRVPNEVVLRPRASASKTCQAGSESLIRNAKTIAVARLPFPQSNSSHKKLVAVLSPLWAKNPDVNYRPASAARLHLVTPNHHRVVALGMEGQLLAVHPSQLRANSADMVKTPSFGPKRQSTTPRPCSGRERGAGSPTLWSSRVTARGRHRATANA